MKKLLSLFICFSLFLSLPFSLFAVDDEGVGIDGGDEDISLLSLSQNSLIYVAFQKTVGVNLFSTYITQGSKTPENSGYDMNHIVIAVPISAEPGATVSASVQFRFTNFYYTSGYAFVGGTPGSGNVASSNSPVNGLNVGSVQGNVGTTVTNNTSTTTTYLYFLLSGFQNEYLANTQIEIFSVDVSSGMAQNNYSDILNTINTNVLALQGGLNNIYSRLGDISNSVSSVLQVVTSIETLTNTISTNLSSFHSDVTSHFLNLQSQLVGHFRDLTSLLINQYNSWKIIFQDFVDLFTSGNNQSQETVENTDKTNQDLENVTNEHDKIEQDVTNDFNSAIAVVDINQGTDFLTSMSATFTWVGTQMTNLFNYGGQIQYLLMYSLILGFALVLIGRGLK